MRGEETALMEAASERVFALRQELIEAQERHDALTAEIAALERQLVATAEELRLARHALARPPGTGDPIPDEWPLVDPDTLSPMRGRDDQLGVPRSVKMPAFLRDEGFERAARTSPVTIVIQVGVVIAITALLFWLTS